MRFVVDAMLGHVARDLRILGYDVAYDPDEHDDALLARAHREDRMLVTLDRVLAQRAGARGLMPRAGAHEDALRDMIERLDLRPDPAAFLTRCSRCGGALAETSSRGLDLPPGIAERHARVSRCAACGHVYWDGTHVRDIRARLGALVDRPSGHTR